MEYALSNVSVNWLDSWVKQVMTVSVIPLLGPISTIEVDIVWRQNLKSFRRLKIFPSFTPLSWTMSWVIPEKHIVIYKGLEIRDSKVSWPAWHLTNVVLRNFAIEDVTYSQESQSLDAFILVQDCLNLMRREFWDLRNLPKDRRFRGRFCGPQTLFQGFCQPASWDQ